MKTERVRVICPKCDVEVMSFFNRDRRVKVTTYSPGDSHHLAAEGVLVTVPAHRMQFTVDVEEELADCSDSLIDAECACGVRSSLPLRGYADAASARLDTRGPRVSTMKAP